MWINESTRVDYPIGNLDTIDDSSTIVYDINKTIIRATKIYIKPTQKQRKIIKGWFKWYRFIYNKCVLYIRKNTNIGIQDLRNNILKQLSHQVKTKIDNSKIPKQSLDEALRQVLAARKSALTNLARGHIDHFRLRCIKSSKHKQCMTLVKYAFSKKYNAIVVRTLGTELETSSPIKGITKTCKLQWNKWSGKFILFVPNDKVARIVEGRKEICSLDPGARTFQTGYDKEQFFEFGTTTGTKIKKLLAKIHKNPSKKKFCRRLRSKIHHIVDELHWKTAKELCINYDTILIGKLSTKRVISRNGNLNKRTKNVLNLLRHYTFRQRLQAKAEEYGATIVVVGEHYTSKTCGGCGERNNVGSSKWYKCSSCDYAIDRDFNAARNIMCKHFYELSFTSSE